MDQLKGSRGRLANILRAAEVEFALAEPARPQKTDTPRSDDPPPPPAPPPPPVPAAPPVPRVEDTRPLVNLLATLGKQAEEFRLRKQETVAEIATLSVELGVALAERLLCSEIGANRQRLDRIVRQVLDRLPGAAAVTLRGHPEDIKLLEKQMTEQKELQSYREVLKFRPDGAARGQLKLDAGDHFVSWDTANCLTEMRTMLLEETNTNG